MMCLPVSPPAPALRTWLRLGLFVLLCLGIGQALEKKVVKSKVGEKVSLPCCHEIPISESLHKYRVYWQKNITDVVLAYSEGNMISSHKRYQNRTEMDPWNLTLWISPMEILDNGSYQCVVQRNSVVVCDESVILFVTADFSKPNITAEVSADSCESTEMVIICSSHGGFPKPRISGALDNMSMEWNATWVSESSFSPYNVTGKLVLNVTKDVNITCSVEYNGFAKSTSLLLKKTNDCFVPPVPPPYNVITASIIIVITFILAITLAARYLPRHVCSHCCKGQNSVEEGVKDSMKARLSDKGTAETSSV
ncbi:T-lymphocyte activation antigen CD80-like [Corvus hawaiiensis]|uniref:T-lymphocyte activation antigen CD80-like n=1 Tax=Corvus hawaiiensis TaxID=134902 RepID=UPI00201A1295|nr:T-lymphocyte activation antigen CD80-like [Corvus hawaiiensis]XP_048150165.1 T-lymphocyte activation antigen CD80-like [Corvus hawaiiensis]XP_048150166.1 T-lymphocyte activation antigen CD80-like [Corvus hawaiiensis]